MNNNKIILLVILIIGITANAIADHVAGAGIKIMDAEGLFIQTTASKNMESGEVRMSKAFGVFNGYDEPEDKRFGNVFLTVRYSDKSAPEWKIHGNNITISFPNGDTAVVVMPTAQK